MRPLIATLLMLAWVPGAVGQESSRYDPKTSYSVFAAYSNDSSRMLIGASQNRRLFMSGVDFSRRLGDRSIYSWRYYVEFIPLELLQNPKLTTATTYTPVANPTPIAIPVGTYQYSSLQPRQCQSASGSGNIYGASNGQAIAIGTYSFTSVCSNPWTYGGGISPLGQKVNFMPRSRLQPYLAMNAGFVTFAETVPSEGATMFNFTFEFGGGVEWSARQRSAWSLDYRYHHISNAGRGMNNPGVDNGTFRVAYGFWR